MIRTGLIVMALCFSLYPVRAIAAASLRAACRTGARPDAVRAVVNVVLLSNWFLRRRGLAVGLLAAGSSLAGATLPLIISPLVNDPALGWRWGVRHARPIAFWLFAVIPGFLLLRERPELSAPGRTAPCTGRRSATSPVPTGSASPMALRSPRALLPGASARPACGTAIQAMNSQVTIFFEQDAGLAPARATLLFSVIFWFSFAGKFLFGLLSDRLAKRRVMLLSALTLLAGCLLLFEFGARAASALTTSLPRLSACSPSCFGLGFGGSFTHDPAGRPWKPSARDHWAKSWASSP